MFLPKSLFPNVLSMNLNYKAPDIPKLALAPPSKSFIGMPFLSDQADTEVATIRHKDWSESQTPTPNTKYFSSVFVCFFPLGFFFSVTFCYNREFDVTDRYNPNITYFKLLSN